MMYVIWLYNLLEIHILLQLIREINTVIFFYNDINKLIFLDREDALKIVLDAQANRPKKYQYEEE